MKKIFKLMAVATLAFTACTTDLTTDNTIGVNTEKTTLEFSIEAEQTRSYLGNDLFIKFEDGDEVGVYVTPAGEGTATQNAKGTISHKDGKAVVTVEVSSFTAGDKVMAYYPYSTVNNNVAADAVILQMHPIQVQDVAGKFNCKYMPMVSVAQTFDTASGNHLLFRPVGSVVELNLYSSNTDYEGAAIHRVVFEAQRHKDDVTGGNYCTGRKTIDLTAVTEEGEIAIPASTTTSWDAPLGIAVDYAYAYRAIADYTAEVKIPANGAKQPVYLCVWPNTYGGKKHDSDDMSKLQVNTSVGKFVLTLTEERRFEYGRAMIRPLSLDLAKEDIVFTSIVADENSVEWLRKNTTSAGQEWSHELSDELVIIASGSECLNVVANPMTAFNKVRIDNTRSAYAQTLDGKYGFRLRFELAEDNTLKRGDKIRINLQGALTDKVDNPDHYYISRLAARNITIVSRGNEDLIVAKERTIATLQPEDIYTEVTIKDVELMKKQTVQAGATTTSGAPYVTGYESSFCAKNNASASLVTMLQDKENNAIFALINPQCGDWRRNVEVPQGVGSVKGVIVHETSKILGNHADGNMGVYQFRPYDETSFSGISTEATDATTLLARWALNQGTVSVSKYNFTCTDEGCKGKKEAGGYQQGSTDAADAVYAAGLVPQNKMHATYGLTDGSALLYSTNRNIVTRPIYYYYGAAKTQNFNNNTYPIAIHHGLANRTTARNTSDGNSQSNYTSIVFPSDVAGFYDWDESGNWTGKTNGIVAEFPASSVSTKMAISFLISPNTGAKGRYAIFGHPIYWKVECSVDGGTTWTPCTNAITGATDGSFDLRTYNIYIHNCAYYSPDNAGKSSGTTSDYALYYKGYSPSGLCSPGYQPQKFILPEAAQGAANVMVKISPRSLALAWPTSNAYNAAIDTGFKATATLDYGFMLGVEDVTVSYVTAQ